MSAVNYDSHSSEILSQDPNMEKVITLAKNIASSRAPVLIEGESGTGKELLARFIHKNSNRKKGPFIAVNCAALPEGLIESELFGYEKGAFTGATSDKAGLFERANGGTFLLDEISELPLLLQSKLLRVLQEGELTRLGGKKTIKINSRIISTSNKSLREMVGSGEFRQDLYYRVNVLKLEIPSLRNRRKDIEFLSHFFTRVSSYMNDLDLKQINGAAMEKLMSWSWPGNVRELENVIERAVFLSQGNEIKSSDICIEEFMADQNFIEGSGQNSVDAFDLCLGQSLDQVEKGMILKTLEYTSNNRTKAADILGISVRTLRNKLSQYKKKHHENDKNQNDYMSFYMQEARGV